MIFSWWKNRRRQRVLAQPFPPRWISYLEENLAYYARLPKSLQSKLHDDLRVFCAEKTWEGCQGLEMSEEISVTVSATACMLILGLDIDYYKKVQTILVYPHGYLGEHAEGVFEGTTPMLGEAHYRGPVILSWSRVLNDNRQIGTGHNLVFHEFAHQLDMLDGSIDGTPPLHNRQMYANWQTAMAGAFRSLKRRLQMGEPSIIDSYGAQNEAEFFAVVTETFFDQPHELMMEEPEVFGVVRDFYLVDPREWIENWYWQE